MQAQQQLHLAAVLSAQPHLTLQHFGCTSPMVSLAFFFLTYVDRCKKQMPRRGIKPQDIVQITDRLLSKGAQLVDRTNFMGKRN